MEWVPHHLSLAMKPVSHSSIWGEVIGMNTYLEIIENQQKQYCYTNVYFTEESLQLTYTAGKRQTRRDTLDLSQIKHGIQDEFLGATRISFHYGDREYVFFSQGNGIIEYLTDHLDDQLVKLVCTKSAS